MNERKPKFKIGEKIEANWAGGHQTKHIITGIKDTYHGFYYTWENNNDGFGYGLHEKHLNKCYS